MTRYSGKPMNFEEDVPVVCKNMPENTIKYKIYKYIMNCKGTCTTSEVHKAVAVTSPRRTIEKRILDLYNQGLIKREHCPCGCAYIYRK
jgi:predicted transcriptional regulator